jgi:hypothetical protein
VLDVAQAWIADSNFQWTDVRLLRTPHKLGKIIRGSREMSQPGKYSLPLCQNRMEVPIEMLGLDAAQKYALQSSVVDGGFRNRIDNGSILTKSRKDIRAIFVKGFPFR